jgi:hypothetical protein
MTTKMKKWHAGATKRRSKYKNRTVGKRLRAKRATKHKYPKRGGVPKWMKKCWPWCNRQQRASEEAPANGPVPVVGRPAASPSLQVQLPPRDIVSPTLVSPVIVSPPADSNSSHAHRHVRDPPGQSPQQRAPRRVRSESAQQSSPKHTTSVIIMSLTHYWKVLKQRIEHNITLRRINSKIPMLIDVDEFRGLTERYKKIIADYGNENRETRITAIRAADVLNEEIKRFLNISTDISTASVDGDDSKPKPGLRMPL